MQLTGYKITNVERTKKYGVAANSLKMLLEKASLKLHVRKIELIHWQLYFNNCIRFPKIRKPLLYVAKDGTAVLDEDYFNTIAPQSLFIVATQQDKVQTGKTKTNQNRKQSHLH